MALSKAQISRAGQTLAFPTSRTNPARLATRVDHEERIQNRFRELFQEGSKSIILDADRTSLQWRILKYFQMKKWISDPKADLERAWVSAKKANAQQGMNAFLGGQGKEKGPTKNLRSIFSQTDQWLLYQAATAGTFSPPFFLQDFLDCVEKAFVAGKGTVIIEFLGRIRNNNKRAGGHEKINPNTLIMSLMWVFPSVPFWLLPSRIIAEVIRVLLEKEKAAASSAINDAIIRAGLVRIPDTVLEKFFSSAADAKGKALLKEISMQAQFDAMTCFSGRRQGS